jgi:alkylation response protein AidB-like acyl-CoA dehydrogenase
MFSTTSYPAHVQEYCTRIDQTCAKLKTFTHTSPFSDQPNNGKDNNNHSNHSQTHNQTQNSSSLSTFPSTTRGSQPFDQNYTSPIGQYGGVLWNNNPTNNQNNSQMKQKLTSQNFPNISPQNFTSYLGNSTHNLATQTQPVNNPLHWRRLGAHLGLTAVDLPGYLVDYFSKNDSKKASKDEQTDQKNEFLNAHFPTPDLPTLLYNIPEFNNVDLTYLYSYISRISLNLRDCIGLGHGRLLIHSLDYDKIVKYNQANVKDNYDHKTGQNHEDQIPEKNPPKHILDDNQIYILSVIEQLLEGTAYCAISITEPTTGSDVSHIQSYCEEVRSENNHLLGYYITGNKEFNARLEQCTHIILFIRSSPDTAGLNCFCIPVHELLSNPPNPSQTPTPNQHPQAYFAIHSTPCYGLHGNSFGGLTMNKVFVSKKYLISSPGTGHTLFKSHFSHWRLFQIAACVGTTEQAVLDVVNYIQNRKVFGKKLSSFSHIQQDIAKWTTELRMSQLLIRDIGSMLDAHQLDEALGFIAMGKSQVVENSINCLQGIQQIWGAKGYTLYLSDIGQRLLDMQGLAIADGATAFMRSLVMRYIYGESFWKEGLDLGDGVGEGEGWGEFGGAENNLFRDKDSHNNDQKKLEEEKSHSKITPNETNKPLQSHSSSQAVPNPSIHSCLNQNTKSITFIQYNQEILAETLKNSTFLLKMSQYDSLICQHGGGSCPTIAIVNFLQFLRFEMVKAMRDAGNGAKSDPLQLNQGQLLNLEVVLGLIYPHLGLPKESPFCSKSNGNFYAIFGKFIFSNSQQAVKNHPEQIFDQIPSQNYVVETHHHVSHPFVNLPQSFSLETWNMLLHSFYRYLQPARREDEGQISNVVTNDGDNSFQENTRNNSPHETHDKNQILPSSNHTSSKLIPSQIYYPYYYLTRNNKPSSLTQSTKPHFPENGSPFFTNLTRAQSSMNIATMIPVYNIFGHGRLSNEQIIWYLHQVLLFFSVGKKDQKQNHNENENSPLKKHKNKTDVFYYINVITHNDALQSCYDSYNRRDVDICLERIPDNRPTLTNSHQINPQEFYMMDSLHINCQCHSDYYRNIQNDQNNPRHDEIKKKDQIKLPTIFEPLYERKIIADNNNIPTDFDPYIGYHNTYFTPRESLTLIDFYNACVLPKSNSPVPNTTSFQKPTSDMSTAGSIEKGNLKKDPESSQSVSDESGAEVQMIGKRVDLLTLPMISFNWYTFDEDSEKENDKEAQKNETNDQQTEKTNTSNPKTKKDFRTIFKNDPHHLLNTSNNYHHDELSDFTHAGRHFIVVKELKWLTNPPIAPELETRNDNDSEPKLPLVSAAKLLITACDPNRPLKDYYFIADEYVYYNEGKKGEMGNETQNKPLRPTVTIRLSVKGFPAKASGLKLVNSVFNVVTFPTNYFD